MLKAKLVREQFFLSTESVDAIICRISMLDELGYPLAMPSKCRDRLNIAIQEIK